MRNACSQNVQKPIRHDQYDLDLATVLWLQTVKGTDSF